MRKFRGKQLTAPHFLNSLTQQYIPDKEGSEESHLASHTGLNRTQTVVSLVKKAGFDVLKTDWLGHTETIDTPEEFWDIQRTFSSIARKRLNDAAPETVELLQQVFFERCRTVQSKGGELVYPFAAFYVVAQKRETD